MYFYFIQWLCKNKMVGLILVRDEKFEVNPTISNRDEPHLIPRIYWDYSYSNILFYFEKHENIWLLNYSFLVIYNLKIQG